MKTTVAVVLLAASVAFAQAVPTEAQRCERVAQVKVPNTTIIAKLVDAGAFQPPGEAPPPSVAQQFRSVPQFCRVTAHAHPSADSDITIEVWLPASGWNGRLRGLGTGGFAGYIPYPAMAQATKRGYATASTDTGHTTGANEEWALGHPEKIVDYGYRGIHEMTTIAKAAVRAYYGHDAQHSYFVGCSNGGRQALMEAQRYPEDYDGILAGAPANNWTHLLTTALWAMQAMGNDPESFIPAAKWKAVEAAVDNACDAIDGVKDGILNDPRQCHFDPATIQCKNADSSACLTAKQVTTLKKIYAGPRDASGRPIFFGLLPGAESRESGWESWVSGKELGKSAGFFFGNQYFKNMVYDNPSWDYHTANIEAAAAEADRKTGRAMNAIDPDLSKLQSRGGKLILFHGWNDPAIPALSTVDYFDQVEKKMGAKANDFVRLYMVPGMQHCSGGPGATSFGGDAAPFDAEHNIFTALEQWVEHGTAPVTVIASKPGADMTRPLCLYPQTAKYKGSGSTNDAGNFACVKP